MGSDIYPSRLLDIGCNNAGFMLFKNRGEERYRSAGNRHVI